MVHFIKYISTRTNFQAKHVPDFFVRSLNFFKEPRERESVCDREGERVQRYTDREEEVERKRSRKREEEMRARGLSDHLLIVFLIWPKAINPKAKAEFDHRRWHSNVIVKLCNCCSYIATVQQ